MTAGGTSQGGMALLDLLILADKGGMRSPQGLLLIVSGPMRATLEQAKRDEVELHFLGGVEDVELHRTIGSDDGKKSRDSSVNWLWMEGNVELLRALLRKDNYPDAAELWGTWHVGTYKHGGAWSSR